MQVTKETVTEYTKKFKAKEDIKRKSRFYIPLPILEEIFQDIKTMPLEEVYPRIAEYYNNNELDSVSRCSGKYRWRITLTAMCDEYGVQFVDEPVMGRRFILHSDGSYDEV